MRKVYLLTKKNLIVLASTFLLFFVLLSGKLFAGPYWYAMNGGYSPTSEFVCSGNQTAISQSWLSGGNCAGPGFTYTVKWYYNTTNSVVVAGATLVQTTTGVSPAADYTSTLLASNIVVPATAGVTYYYFVSVTNGCSGAYNNPSTTVPVTNANTAPVGGTATPAAGSVACGGSTTITLAGGYKGAIQWQISTDGGTTWYDISGKMDPTLATGALYGTTKYRATLTCGCPTQSTAYSTVATVTNTGTTTATWLTGGTTAWGTATNWSTGVVPTGCTDVTIPSGGTQPTISAVATCHNLTVNGTLTRAQVLSIYGNLTINGTLPSSANFIDLYGIANTWGGTSTFTGTAPIRVQGGANYTLISNQTISHLNHNGASAIPVTDGQVNLGIYTLTITAVWGCVCYMHFNTGMLNLQGGGSIDPGKSDYGTGVLWVNSSVDNFGFNLEDDYYSVWFNNSAGTTKFGKAAIDVYVKQDLWIRSPGTLDLSTSGSNAIVVGHDFINDDVLSAATSFIRMEDFNVAQVQNIRSTNGTVTTFNGLEINNSGTGVYLQINANTNATATGVLRMTAGPLFLNGYKLTVQRGATAAIERNGGTQTGYIVSETNSATNPSILQWNIAATGAGAHVFPFGTSSGTYIPVTFNNSANAGNVSISTRPTSLPNNEPRATGVTSMYSAVLGADDPAKDVIDRWWEISSSLGSSTANVTFTYLGSENTMDATYQTSEIAVQHWKDATTKWNDGKGGVLGTYTATGTNGLTTGANAVTANSLTEFGSPFILVGKAAPLPITLLTFDATYNGTYVDLTWITATETNNDYFTVERSAFSSPSGEGWGEVVKADGAGNSNEEIPYYTVDRNPFSGVSYYRLKQTDFDGRYAYSDVVAVNIVHTYDFSIHPNPAKNTLNVSLSCACEGEVNIEFKNIIGKTVKRAKYAVKQGGNILPVDIRSLPQGLYFIKVTSDSDTYMEKFVKE